MSLGEYKQARDKAIFARDELQALFDDGSDADMKEDDGDEETSFPKRNEPGVESRRLREDDSDALISKRSPNAVVTSSATTTSSSTSTASVATYSKLRECILHGKELLVKTKAGSVTLGPRNILRLAPPQRPHWYPRTLPRWWPSAHSPFFPLAAMSRRGPGPSSVMDVDVSSATCHVCICGLCPVELVLNTIHRFYNERDIIEADVQHLQAGLETAKQTAFEASQWKTKFNVLIVITDGQTQALQDVLARVNVDSATLAAQLASDLAAANQSSELAQARQGRDVAMQEILTTREALQTATREADMLRASRGTQETDLRRVTASLTAHAEEHQRDTTRIQNLEDLVARSESARVIAESVHSEVEACVLGLTPVCRHSDVSWKSPSSRAGTPASARRTRSALDEQGQRLRIRIVELGQERDRATRDYADQVAIWDRLLNNARTCREFALRFRDALGARIVASVREAGGTLETNGILRQSERAVEGAANRAVSVPADPRHAELSSPDSSAA
ncbi:unnamed protein product [Phytophthora fragariaefolia]|uniref:Unnamed protein product n=1 Tax=Phytophthora fragariaefolia TaxID=1490495 RepID=A0A9W6WS01_9STRA|nr:unnamed protein product [Phytophthora fragariaefolia]